MRTLMESLLATEQYELDKQQAEASSGETFKNFTDNVEEEAVKELKEPTEEEPLVDDQPTDTEEANPTTGTDEEYTDEDIVDSTDLKDELNGKDSDSESTDVTNESWSETTSALGTGIQRIAAGIAGFGITYGPLAAKAMYKGVLWGFSRLGSLSAATTRVLAKFIERNVNSLERLDTRLKDSRVVINQLLESDAVMPDGEYSKASVIALLKVGKSLSFAYNINSFSKELASSTKSLANEISRGYGIVSKLTQIAGAKAPSDMGYFMNVDGSKLNMTKGSIRGYENNTGLTEQYHSVATLPGDTLLIFNSPVTTGRSMEDIASSYKEASMFLGVNQSTYTPVDKVKHLSIEELSTLHMSLVRLKAVCVDSMQLYAECAKAQPSLTYSVKKLFLRLADEKAKVSLADSLVEPIYLRAQLSSGVFVSGGMDLHTHAARVLSAGLTLIDYHTKKML